MENGSNLTRAFVAFILKPLSKLIHAILDGNIDTIN